VKGRACTTPAAMSTRPVQAAIVFNILGSPRVAAGKPNRHARSLQADEPPQTRCC
jgi:hypothetical protein